MKCCSQCDGIERLFNESIARKELEDYRKKGPSQTTRILIDALKANDIQNKSLIDIGGGVGAIQHELLQAGAQSAANVDASTAYITAARKEAERLGQAERVTYHHGNFVNLAPEIEPADIVTLDRVICCYPDMEALVGLSSARARQFYGVVFPRDSWWMQLGRPVLNGLFWLQRNPFRFFVHPTQAIEAVINANGLKRHFYRAGVVWQVIVYARFS
jgi:magnesium-protoporphyrin O-methyltransferase